MLHFTSVVPTGQHSILSVTAGKFMRRSYYFYFAFYSRLVRACISIKIGGNHHISNWNQIKNKVSRVIKSVRTVEFSNDSFLTADKPGNQNVSRKKLMQKI